MLKNIDCGYSLESPRRKISDFFPENSVFLMVKFSIYLNRCIFVMIASDTYLRFRHIIVFRALRVTGLVYECIDANAFFFFFFFFFFAFVCFVYVSLLSM